MAANWGKSSKNPLDGIRAWKISKNWREKTAYRAKERAQTEMIFWV